MDEKEERDTRSGVGDRSPAMVKYSGGQSLEVVLRGCKWAGLGLETAMGKDGDRVEGSEKGLAKPGGEIATRSGAWCLQRLK